MDEKVYSVKIVRTRVVDVYASSCQDAKETVEQMYLSGDACAELGDATYGVVNITDETEE